MLHNSLLHKSSSLTNINFTAFTWNPVNGIIFLRRVSNTLLAILAWSPTLVLKLLGKIFYLWLSCKRWNLKVGSALVVGFCPQYSQNRWEMFLLLWDGRGFFFMRRTSYWSVWVIHLVLSHVSCVYKKFSDMELHNFLLLGILELKKLLGFFLSFLVYSFAVCVFFFH